MFNPFRAAWHLYFPAKPSLLLGKPVPNAYRRMKAVAASHDRRLTAAIFEVKKGGPFKIALWKAWQDPKTKKWIHSSSFYPDEIDPLLRMLQEVRHHMLT